MKTVRFGIIGCGMIAGLHAQAIERIEGAVLGGAYDPVRENAESFAQKYQCRVYETLGEMLADKELDAVNICTPSGTHAELAVAAAGAGKHVVVEKPLAIRLEDARAVVEEGRKNDVKICVISQLRFSDGVQTLRRAVQEGRFGRMVLGSLSMRYYRSEEYYRKGGWRGRWISDGGGALMNQGIHGLDILCYLCGPVVSVRAFYRTLHHEIEVEDTLCAILEFQNGALGTVEASTAVKPGSARRIEIGGTEGSAVLTEDAVTQWEVDAPLPVEKTSWQIDAAKDPTALDVTGHRLQLENLIAAMEGRESLLVDAEEGCRMVELILGIYQSARTGGTINFEIKGRDT